MKMTPVCVHDRTYIDNVSAIFLRLYSKNTQNPLFPTKIHSRRILSPPCERHTDQETCLVYWPLGCDGISSWFL